MRKPLTTSEFISKAKAIHGNKFDYLLTKYINNKTKVKIICPTHGIFEQLPCNHLAKKGCPSCGQLIINSKLRKTYIDFVDRSKSKHDNKFNYSLINEHSYHDMSTKVPIICETHGTFYITPHNHLQGQGCPKCKQSFGEKEIELYLTKNNINHIPQYRFNKCKDKKTLPFDFYLPDHKICIEFDGEQHYKPMRFGSDENKMLLKFKQTQHHDSIKNQFCNNNQIKLIRIPYYNFKNIITILNESLT